MTPKIILKITIRELCLGEMPPKNTFLKWDLKKAKWFSSVQNAAVSSRIEHIIAPSAKGALGKWITIAHGLTTVLERATKNILYSLRYVVFLKRIFIKSCWNSLPFLSNPLQFYIALMSFYALFLAVNHFIGCLGTEWQGCPAYSPPATIIFLLFLMFEGLLFSLFTSIMFGTQVSAIWYDETAIESLKKEEARWTRKSRW